MFAYLLEFFFVHLLSSYKKGYLSLFVCLFGCFHVCLFVCLCFFSVCFSLCLYLFFLLSTAVLWSACPSLLLNKYILFDACSGLAVGGPIAVRLFPTNTGA